jgi:hypothetical protein
MASAYLIETLGECSSGSTCYYRRGTKVEKPSSPGCVVGNLLPDSLFVSGGGSIPDNIVQSVPRLFHDYVQVRPYLTDFPMDLLKELQDLHDNYSSIKDFIKEDVEVGEEEKENHYGV